VLTLLNLLAAVALLVWGTHIVRRDILRAYGGDLRRVLSRSVGNRFNALAAGLGVTSLLQSSMATALLTTSFTSQGLIATVPALAIMLGADIGTALISVVFSLDLSWLSPLLIFVGVVIYLPRQNTRAGRMGRILIGVGLIILALQLISIATQPLTRAAGVKVIFASLTGDPLLDMAVAAGLTIVSFSSLAVVLLTASLVSAKLIPLYVALGLVLGANLGSGLLGLTNTSRMPVEARRVTLGNFLFKFAGAVLALPFLGSIERGMNALGVGAPQAVVFFHLAFNLGLALLFVGAIGPVARLTERLLPATPQPESESQPKHLDAGALASPALAIGCAAREAIRIGDVVERMLAGLLQVISTDDKALAKRIRKMDDVVDSLYTAVKLYLTQISREAMEEREGRRWADIVSFTINLEQIGDIVERIVKDVEDKKIDKGLAFSDAGLEEIRDLHARLMSNLRLGMGVFLHGDLKSAQQLLAEKVLFRDLERAYADSHLGRLAGNTVQSIETSSLHLDLIADMKRINSHICSVAYPILEQAGVLHHTRLKDADEADNGHPARDGNGAGLDEPLPDERARWDARRPRPA
jgi:phosphate:Na+ symporter